MSPCSLVLCMDSNELLIRYWHLDKSRASGWEGRLPGQAAPSRDLNGREAQPCQEHNPGFVRGMADRAWASAL